LISYFIIAISLLPRWQQKPLNGNSHLLILLLTLIIHTLLFVSVLVLWSLKQLKGMLDYYWPLILPKFHTSEMILLC